MTAYNKLKIAILAIMAAPTTSAVNVDPVQVQSAPGELLYAEMHFRQSNVNTPIEVSLASLDDLASIGASHQPPGHLNFYTRRNSNGSGVITITSSRPITDRELNIIIKIKEGNAAHLQHVRTPLKSKIDLLKASLSPNERPLSPVVVVSEKDIALSLPVSTQYNVAKSANTVTEKPLAIQRIAPPTLSSSSVASIASPHIQAVTQTAPNVTPPAIAVPKPNSASFAVPVTVQPVEPIKALSTAAPSSAQPSFKAKEAETLASEPQANLTAKPEKTTAPTPVASSQDALIAKPKPAIQPLEKSENIATESHDPLVKKFAEERAAQQQKPAVETAKKLAPPASVPPSPNTQATYVVQANESLWKIAQRVAHAQNKPVNEVMQNIKKNNEHAFIAGDANRLRNGAALNLNAAIPTKEVIKVPDSALHTQKIKPTTKTKYRLNQAEMSLVAESEQDSKLLSANQNTLKNQSSKELALKVMTAREKTVKLQRNVTEIELALNQKDHRIQLLNARLARLEQQLKAQNADKKPTH